ncbi:hypothetical protein BKA61DRAFT_590768 [Leptodontidium sp. MPI-SDFR-AT-0119]|nr:hypothetical protein BKA61DRAFT_590768 [Leptodontidium sp. MPI-SDFR-AT-0119]
MPTTLQAFAVELLGWFIYYNLAASILAGDGGGVFGGGKGFRCGSSVGELNTKGLNGGDEGKYALKSISRGHSLLGLINAFIVKGG